MKTFWLLKYIPFVCFTGLALLAGCMTATPKTSTAPFSIIMKSDSLFVVNDRSVNAANLIKILKGEKVPKNEPLVIEMQGNVPITTIRSLTQKLATAGYKPFFKSSRHFKTETGGRGSSGVLNRNSAIP